MDRVFFRSVYRSVIWFTLIYGDNGNHRDICIIKYGNHNNCRKTLAIGQALDGGGADVFILITTIFRWCYWRRLAYNSLTRTRSAHYANRCFGRISSTLLGRLYLAALTPPRLCPVVISTVAATALSSIRIILLREVVTICSLAIAIVMNGTNRCFICSSAGRITLKMSILCLHSPRGRTVGLCFCACFLLYSTKLRARRHSVTSLVKA